MFDSKLKPVNPKEGRINKGFKNKRPEVERPKPPKPQGLKEFFESL